MAQEAINSPLALYLRLRGKAWSDIGKELARQIGREMPFQGHSVQKAVSKYQRENLRCLSRPIEYWGSPETWIDEGWTKKEDT